MCICVRILAISSFIGVLFHVQIAVRSDCTINLPRNLCASAPGVPFCHSVYFFGIPIIMLVVIQSLLLGFGPGFHYIIQSLLPPLLFTVICATPYIIFVD